MAWTAPRTWVAGETVTAAVMNTHVRDNFKAIGDPWTAYGSGASWTALTTPPALGDGSWSGSYMQVGKMVTLGVTITMGPTTTYGTGQWVIAPPVPGTSRRASGVLDIVDTSAGLGVTGRAIAVGSNIYLTCPGTSAGGYDRAVTNTVPFTWASGDSITMSLTYEAA